MKNKAFYVFFLLVIANCFCWASFDEDYESFTAALDNNRISDAMKYGKKAFQELDAKYVNDPGFIALKSKFLASEFLAKKMNKNLIEAKNKSFQNLFQGLKKTKVSVAPAKNYYDASKKVFSKNSNINNLLEKEKDFLTKFYNVKLEIYISSLAKTGKGLAIAVPDFKGTHDYVLVLPLLHCLNGESVNIDTFPLWLKNKENMGLLTNSCLKHYGLPYQSMVIAKKITDKEGFEPFSEFEYYLKASEECKSELPSVAVNCLEEAITLVENHDYEQMISLKFGIVEIWLNSQNYILASGYSKELYEMCEGDNRYADAVWTYFYSLSRSDNVKTILAEIDEFLADERCSEYYAKLIYIKWWSLRRSRSNDEQVLAIEHQLLKNYSDNPMVAPIMLSKATDLLAKQEYKESLTMLEKLINKFPATKAAEQARRMQQKLSMIIK